MLKLLEPLKLMSLLIVFIMPAFVGAETTGTKENLGKLQGVDIEVLVQKPSEQATPLQIVYLFQSPEGNIATSSDEALNHLISDLRKTNEFKGEVLETLLITPPENTVPAKKLLIIGLGDKDTFEPELMKMVGIMAMREALRLGVSDFSIASDLNSESTGNIIEGALLAYQTQTHLKQNASDPLSVTKITLLSGPSNFDDSKAGIKKVMGNE